MAAHFPPAAPVRNRGAFIRRAAGNPFPAAATGFNGFDH